VECKIPKMNLAPGVYSFNLMIKKYRTGEPVDSVQHAVSFEVIPRDVFGTGRTQWGSNVLFLDADFRLLSG